MAKKKANIKPVEDQKTNDKLANLKSVASAFRTHMNTQFQEDIAYVPNVETVAKVSVSKYLKSNSALFEEIGLPGLPFGNITHVYGKPNTGKTTALMEAIVDAQEQGVLPILILTEHKFDFSRIEKFMGGDPEAMLVLHADNLEQAYGFMEKVLRDLATGKIVLEDEEGNDQVIDMTDQDCFIFMDSLGNTMSESELEYDVEDHGKSMGKGAKAIKTLTRRINQILGKRDIRQKCGILLLNQSYMSMPSYGPSVETPYGGDGVIYSCVLNIRLRRKKDLKMTLKGKDMVIGLETIVEVKKNHITHQMAQTSVYTTAIGMITADKKALDDFKKQLK